MKTLQKTPEEKTLQNFLDLVAQKYGHNTWNEVEMYESSGNALRFSYEAAELYTSQYKKEVERLEGEKAELKTIKMQEWQLKNLLIELLSDEYDHPDAVRQINEAKITVSGNQVEVIYSNGVKNIFEIYHVNKVKVIE